MNEPKCKTDPRAPHGFDRNASHSADRYVCECEGWEPPTQAGWQPIATAPKHTAVLAGRDNWKIPMLLMWLDGPVCEAGAGWYAVEGGDWSKQTYAPTHWMPLPEPPETELAHNAK